MNCITIEDKELEYNGNIYSKFFFYPKPEEDKLGHYKMCEDYIMLNPGIEFTKVGTKEK